MTVTRGRPGDRDWKQRAARAWGGAAATKPYARQYAAGTVALGPGRPWRLGASVTWALAGSVPAALGAGACLLWIPAATAPSHHLAAAFIGLPAAAAALGQAVWVGRRLGTSRGWVWLALSLAGLAVAALPAWVLFTHLLPAMLGPRPAGDAMGGAAILGLLGLLVAGVPARLQALGVRGSSAFAAIWAALAALGGGAGAALWPFVLDVPLREALPALDAARASALGAALAVGSVLATALLAGRALPADRR